MKRKTPILLLLLCLTAGFLQGCKECSKRVTCPAYEAGLAEAWFPYASGPTLTYRAGPGEQQVFDLRETYSSDDYDVPASGGRDAACEAHVDYWSTQTDARGNPRFSAQFQQSRRSGGALDQHLANILIERFPVTVYDLRDNGLRDVQLGIDDQTRMQPQARGTLTLGNRTFSNVLFAARDTVTDKTAGLFEVYFVKGQGIVAYALYPEAKLWVLQ